MNWKGEVLAFLLEWFLPVALTAILIVFFRRGWPSRLPLTAWNRWAIPVFLVSRLGYIFLLYGVLRFEGGGDFQYWVAHSRPLLEGAVPGKDVVNAYGPLFPYLQAGGLWLAADLAVGVLLPYLVADAVNVFLGKALATEYLGEEAGRWVGAWMLLSPLTWQELVLRGQDESMFLATILGSVWLIHKNRVFLGMLTLAFGLCATKVTYLPYAGSVLLVTWRTSPRRVPAILTFSGATALVCFVYWARGGDLLSFMGHDPSYLWWANFSFPLYHWLPQSGRMASLCLFLVVSFAAIVVGARAHSKGTILDQYIVSLVIVNGSVLLFQPYVLTVYIYQGVFFILLLAWSVRARAIGQCMLGSLALLGCFTALTSDTADPLYRWGAAPAFLVACGVSLVIAMGRRIGISSAELAKA